MDVIDRIKDQIGTNPVLLYMKGTPDFPQCGFSAQAVAALRACGAEFAFVNIFEDQEVREALKRYSNWPTYPQLYVGGDKGVQKQLVFAGIYGSAPPFIEGAGDSGDQKTRRHSPQPGQPPGARSELSEGSGGAQ